jgi:tRNA A37 methylthiotransferase MiaB
MQSVEDDEKVNSILDEVDPIVQKGKRSVYLSAQMSNKLRSDVEQALETLKKAISMVRENTSFLSIRPLLALPKKSPLA